MVALSGGVDSSVAAALLIDQGHEVYTAYMRLADAQGKSIDTARAIAAYLKTKFFVFDLDADFEKIVVKKFIEEYRRGRTPNPCVICNERIKFGALLRAARKLKCSMLATGHYARIAEHRGQMVLKKGIDANEQSYFLYRLKPAQLKRVLFPLGDLTKSEVRSIAMQHGLPSSDRSKSQDACFIPGADFIEFMRKRIREKPGLIINKQREVLGRHKGVWRYTYGQRRGLGISHHRPVYVLGINARNNTVIVGEQKDVFGRELIAEKMNYIDQRFVDKEISVKVKIRYTAVPASARLVPLSSTRARFILKNPQWAITPGQSVVAYQRDRVIGGGIIAGT